MMAQHIVVRIKPADATEEQAEKHCATLICTRSFLPERKTVGYQFVWKQLFHFLK